MPSRRLSAALGPLIALVLIGGVIAAVMGGSDDAGTDFAAPSSEEPSFSEAPSPEPEDSATPAPSESAVAQATESETVAPIASEEGTPAPAVPAPTESGTPPAATPQPAPTSGGDDGAATGGWVGGTPNTGTAISAAGLLLLAVGGGLLWLRRSRA